MASKARLLQVETGLRAMVEVHQVEVEVVGLVGLQMAMVEHQAEDPLVAGMVHQVAQDPLSRPVEEEVHLGAVVVLLVVVGVLRDQIQLRRMPRWLRAFARKLVIIGRMLLRNIQVGCAWNYCKYFYFYCRSGGVQERNA